MFQINEIYNSRSSQFAGNFFECQKSQNIEDFCKKSNIIKNGAINVAELKFLNNRPAVTCMSPETKERGSICYLGIYRHLLEPQKNFIGETEIKLNKFKVTRK